MIRTVALEDHRVEGGRLLLTLHAGQRRPEFIALGDAVWSHPEGPAKAVAAAAALVEAEALP